MKAITKKWRKWIVLPLAVVLVAGAVLGVQMNRAPSPAYASGVAATNVTLTGQNISSQYTLVQFDTAWDYSWRDSVNWDAAWIFVKYKVSGGDWAHATLNTSGHTAPSGSTISTPADGKGVFIYRSAVGTGSVNWTGVQLRWNYGADGVANNAIVQVKVFAIEMVYIPQGPLLLHSGTSSATIAEFTSSNSISSEAAIPEGAITWAMESINSGAGTADGSSGYNAALGPSYPKGYQAIYSMKYEMSQRQYAEFLNMLTSTQANTYYPGMPFCRYYIISNVDGVYGCDANNNGILNESTDGGWTACNYLSWADGLAYADWAGLRPMTELEFEKICRDPGIAGNEYAWGTTDISQATGISNANTSSEVASTTAANAVFGNLASVPGPLRVGGLTSATDTRVEAGASYYGVMEMSGNLWERVVTVAKYARNGSSWIETGAGAFNGQHGDGSLDTNGYANVSTWPSPTATIGYTAVGAGVRGGDWVDIASYLRVSDRHNAADPNADRFVASYGFRLVRTP